ncbi:MAG TPA: DegT/DnrJ/EryC1/StrS family aminotransferase [Candidatus Dormibacteraeota bacterium]|nr:DegT/DnrJ/EryC1/StrS family aminotransferase [Candidatus Dormibacteraeota bacterium]
MEKNSRLDDSLLYPTVFPGVDPVVEKSYRGDADTPVRNSSNPFPSVFPRKIDPQAKHYLDEVIRSGLTSDMVPRFEKAFAEACGVSYAVAVANCTAACHTAVAACGFEPGDEVIVSAITDYGSVMGVLVENCVPVFADVDVNTGNTTADAIAKVITRRTRAIILVYFYGMMIDVDSVVKLAKKHGLILIEDCCQSPLADYKGKKAGSIGDMGCFSLDAEKHLSTDGGGVITTDNSRLAERLRRFAILRGSVGKQGFGRIHTELGFNYRYSSLQAAVGLAQLASLPQQNEKRRKSAWKLTELLERIDGAVVCRPPAGIDHIYWLYSIQLDMKKFNGTIDEIAGAMVEEGMRDCGTARYYLIPEALSFLHSRIKTPVADEMTAIKRAASKYRYSADQYPQAKRHLERTIRWAWTPDYTDRDINDMAKVISKVLNFYRTSS